MKHFKILALSLTLMAASVLMFAGAAHAQNVKTGNAATVSSGETVDSMLFMSGNNVTIAGTVNGDLYCAGQSISISGTVNGDVFCAGQTVTVSGKVTGSARLAGQSVTLTGNVGGSATVAAQTFVIEKGSVIGQDVLGGTQNATVNGQVTRDYTAGANNLTVNGDVGRNVSGGIENLTVGSTGKVGGNANYTSNNQPTVINGGQIAGAVTIKAPKKHEKNVNSFSIVRFSVFTFFYTLVSLVLAAVALVLLFPSVFQAASTKAIKSPGRTALIGLGAIILAPLAILILLASILGTPLGILALLMWILVVLLSGPFSAYTLGRLMLKNKPPVLMMLAGSSLLVVLYFIPVLGFLVMLAAYLFGVGMFLEEAMRRVPKPTQKLS